MLPYEFSAERFSRWMAYVLRHNPARYGLQPDRHGYVDVEDFLTIAKRRYPNVTPEQLRDLVTSGGTGRFELAGSRLRARYGHSIVVDPPGPPIEPPEWLYHGTDAAQIEAMLTRGLLPMDRRMLHLSDRSEDALAVAQHKSNQPVIVRVAAQQAHQAGIAFYREGRVYVVAHIPSEFLQCEPLPAASDTSSG